MRLLAPCRAATLALLLLPVQPLAGLAASKAEAETPTPKTPQKVQKDTKDQKESAPGVTHLGGGQGWDAYSNDEKGHKICYVVGSPSKSEPADVKRAKASASVTHRPGEKIINEVSFNAGYLFKEGSEAELSVDGRKFTLFTNKDTAWARDATIDKAVVSALAKGKQAVIKGVSARGTATTDTYTLAGLGQALGQIDKACGVKR